MASVDSKQKNHGIFINIGFNKGFNFASWMNRFAPWTQINAGIWFGLLEKINPVNVYAYGKDYKDICGNCGCCYDCKEVVPLTWTNDFAAAERNYSFIGMDLNKQTVLLTEKLMQTFNASHKLHQHGISWYLVQGAGSDKDGIVKVPKCVPGSEICRIAETEKKQLEEMQTTSTDSFEDIRAIPVDTLFLEYLKMHYKTKSHLMEALDHWHANDSRPLGHNKLHKVIDVLKIDTEGFDAKVIEGASHLLKQRAFRSISFEYHSIGLWPSLKLKDAVNLLAQYDYDCFFEGSGRLWRITSSCWDEQYEFHVWSNVLCMLRGDIWHETIDKFVVRRC